MNKNKRDRIENELILDLLVGDFLNILDDENFSRRKFNKLKKDVLKTKEFKKFKSNNIGLYIFMRKESRTKQLYPFS
jgi:hypothetical protein